jgi:hypothetical protein
MSWSNSCSSRGRSAFEGVPCLRTSFFITAFMRSFTSIDLVGFPSLLIALKRHQFVAHKVQDSFLVIHERTGPSMSGIVLQCRIWHAVHFCAHPPLDVHWSECGKLPVENSWSLAYRRFCTYHISCVRMLCTALFALVR